MSNEPSISLDQAKAIVSTKTAPRVTEESIKARITDVTYYRFDTLTICIITMANGFKSMGKSVPASKANFDAAVGERYAYDDAFKPLWQLEAYLLLERMNNDVVSAGIAEFIAKPKKSRKPRVVKAKPEPVPAAQPVVSAEPSSSEPPANPFPWTQRAATA